MGLAAHRARHERERQARAVGPETVGPPQAPAKRPPAAPATTPLPGYRLDHRGTWWTIYGPDNEKVGIALRDEVAAREAFDAVRRGEPFPGS